MTGTASKIKKYALAALVIAVVPGAIGALAIYSGIKIYKLIKKKSEDKNVQRPSDW